MSKARELSVVPQQSIGFKNRIINGAMQIDQRNAGASVTPTATGAGTYTLDRWQAYITQASKFSVQQNAGSVTPPVGFSKYLGATSLSAYSVISSDLFLLNQFIEGFNIADLAWGTVSASPITLSFWVRSSLTGTFGGTLTNNGNTRSYPFTYTISSANTWEQKTINISGDTSGTWATDSNTGIGVRFSLGTGSTYLGTAGSWASAGYFGATGQTNVVGTNGATFYITGVQLEKGSTATSFDYRPYGTELALCQRYLPAFNNIGGGTFGILGAGIVASATQYYVMATFPVTPRVIPTGLTVSSPAHFTANPFSPGGGAASAVTFASASFSMARIVLTSSGMTANAPGDWGMNNTSANLYFTGCEL